MDISLALGGGGAKGIAHLGVLRALLKKGFKVRAIAGTSVGGVIGALFAAGYLPDEIIAKFIQVDQSTLFGRQPSDGPSLFGVAGIQRVLDDMLGEKTFQDLQTPFIVTAVDLNSEREIIINRGRVVNAILATIAMPGIFPPQAWNEYLLVDGGLLNPVPVDPVRKLKPRLPVIAVTLSSGGVSVARIIEPHENVMYRPILRQIARLRVAQAFDIFVNSINIANHFLSDLRLQIDHPDIIIRPEVARIGVLDEVEIEEVVKLGEIATEKVAKELTELFSWRMRLKRSWMR